jgi:phosphate starvation-inducible PhoH-like protein
MVQSTAISTEIEIDDAATLVALAGPANGQLKDIADQLGVEVGSRGHRLLVAGNPERVALARRFFTQISDLASDGIRVSTQDYLRAIHALEADTTLHLRDIFCEVVLTTTQRRPISARGLAQRCYLHAMQNHDLTFSIGPAGTGKTYLAMAVAVSALLAKQVKRIVLTRPAVEAGEKLGFLPGDLEEKVNPYLRPLYDALDDMLEPDRVDALLKRGQIEVAPLAFMRGRTLNDCFVILDEAQNATSQQMRMFLTRLGCESRTVVTGDITQVDLPTGQCSGLAEARSLLKNIEGIAFCTFTDLDVVRHPLVQRIVVAYESRDQARAEAAAARDGGG